MPKFLKAPLLGCLGCVLALTLLTVVLFRVGGVEHADASLLHRLMLEHEGSAWNVARAFAGLADPVPMVILLAATCALGLRWGRRRELVAGLAVVVGANLSTQVLKHLLDHHRFSPFLGIFQPWHDAYPSGHTTAAVALAVALFLVVPPARRLPALVIGVAFSVVVGLAVVLIEWHYPSDVVAGALVSLGWGCAAVAALRLAAGERQAPGAQASSRFAISTK
jgi:membrane-associated phospholipid phosphatase